MSDTHDIDIRNRARGKGPEISLAEFCVVAGRHTAYWQFRQITPFSRYVEGATSYKEKAWCRTEYDWWVIFDRFTELENQNGR